MRHSRFAAVGCGRPMRAGPAFAEKSNTPGSRKNSVTPISSELTAFATRWGFRSSSSRAAWVEWTFMRPQTSRQSTLERLGAVGRGIQSGAPKTQAMKSSSRSSGACGTAGTNRAARFRAHEEAVAEPASCPRSKCSSDHELRCCSRSRRPIVHASHRRDEAPTPPRSGVQVTGSSGPRPAPRSA